MSFRPRNYQEALDYINARRDRHAGSRIISREQTGGRIKDGGFVRVRDSIVAHTNSPMDTFGPNPPPLSFRQWDTDIATFYPGGMVAVIPYDSVSTKARMEDMNLPEVVGWRSAGMTERQARRLETTQRVMIKGFPYGVAMPDRGEDFLLNERRELDSTRPEPVDVIYVEAEDGLHARFNTGRRRVLRALKQYHDMVCAMADVQKAMSMLAMASKQQLVDAFMSGMTAQQLTEEWIPQLLVNRHPEDVARLYATARYYCALHDLTDWSCLWTKKQVPSRELDQWM